MDEAKHGIILNPQRHKYEAWCKGKLMGSCSVYCSEETIKIWTERYNEYLNEKKV